MLICKAAIYFSEFDNLIMTILPTEIEIFMVFGKLINANISRLSYVLITFGN